MESALAVIATYNEAENIRCLVERIVSLPTELALLIVDDNSPDGTGTIADEIASCLDCIHVIHRRTKQGLGPALRQGFSWGMERGYQKIINLDGDLSHNPGEIPTLLENANNADLVIGSRYVNGIRVINWPPRRLALSLAAANYIRVITGMPIRDPTSGFRCFRTEALSFALREPLISVGYSFHVEVLHRIWSANMLVLEVPVMFVDRVEGSTKMNSRIIAEAIWVTLRLLMQRRFCRSPVVRNRGRANAAAARSLCPKSTSTAVDPHQSVR